MALTSGLVQQPSTITSTAVMIMSELYEGTVCYMIFYVLLIVHSEVRKF